MTNWTNRHNLPESLVNAIQQKTYVREGHISATGLIRPPQMACLEELHREEITTDVSERVFAVLGEAVHVVLDRAGADNALQEERLSIEVGGWTVTGKPDLYCGGGLLLDYKVTSCWSFILGDKPEWEAQLNIYAALYRENEFSVKQLQIVSLLRDWIRRRASEPDYPDAQSLTKEIPLWSHQQAMAYIGQRVALHKQARGEGVYPECTDQERWAKPERWAVKKKGNKRATRLFKTESEASVWAQSLNKTKEGVYLVEHRPGESVRCEQGYCKAAPWCEQWQKLSGGNGQP